MTGLIAHYTGAASEARVEAVLLSRGWDVYRPVVGQSRHDLLYLKDGRFVRVQVKSASRCRTGPYTYEQARLVSSNKPPKAYTVEDCDEIWIVGTAMWCFPIDIVSGRTSLYLGTDNPRPNKTKKNYDPDDYLVKEKD